MCSAVSKSTSSEVAACRLIFTAYCRVLCRTAPGVQCLPAQECWGPHGGPASQLSSLLLPSEPARQQGPESLSNY